MLGRPGAAPGGGAAERSVLRLQPAAPVPTPAPLTRRPGSDPGAQPVAVTLRRRRRGRAGPGWGAAALDPRPAGRWREMSNPGTRRNGSSIKIRLTGRHDRAAALAPPGSPRDPAHSTPPPLHRPLSRDRRTPHGVRPSLALPAPPPGCSAGAAPAAQSPPSASGPAPAAAAPPSLHPAPPPDSSDPPPSLARLSPRLFCGLPPPPPHRLHPLYFVALAPRPLAPPSACFPAPSGLLCRPRKPGFGFFCCSSCCQGPLTSPPPTSLIL